MIRARCARAVWLVTLLPPVLFACGAFGGDDPPPGPDAASEAAPAPGDGGAPPNDATPVPDAGFCESRSPVPTFCADFDHGKQVDHGFTRQAGNVTIDSTVARSLPSSMRAVGEGAFLERTLTTTAHAVWDVSFAMRVDARDDAGALPFYLPLRAVDDTGKPECTYNIELYPANARLAVTRIADGGAASDLLPMSARPVPGQWTALRLVAEEKPGGVKVTLTVDGTVAVEATTGCPAIFGPPRLIIGQVYGGDGVDLHIDDVVFDVR